MTDSTRMRPLIIGVVVLLLSAGAWAGSALKMNLEEMTGRAGTIVRARVTDAIDGSAWIAGAEFPTVTYLLTVAEAFKGISWRSKGETTMEVTFLNTDLGEVEADGAIRRLALPEIPRLEVGREYLLLTTRPSQAGLSVPVGLGQGAFRIEENGDGETALNEAGNIGLFEGMPVRPRSKGFDGERASYRELADIIHNLVNRKR